MCGKLIEPGRAETQSSGDGKATCMRHDCSQVLGNNIGTADNTCDNDTGADNVDMDNNHGQFSHFFFMPVNIGYMKVSALLDSGSSINLISRYLFDKIPQYCKGVVNTSTQETMTLANNQVVNVEGHAKVKVIVPNKGKHTIQVYIIDQVSHPLILGTTYLKSNNIILDFSDRSVKSSKFNVKCKQTTVVLPNSEAIVWGKVPDGLAFGTQCVCTIGTHVSKAGLLVAKAVVTVTLEQVVPVKIINPTSSVVTVYRGTNLAKLTLLDSNDGVLVCSRPQQSSDGSKLCANV